MKLYKTIALALSLVGCDGGNGVPKLYNGAPTISGSIESIRAGEQLNFIPQSSDADGDTLKFSISGQAEWMIFDPQTGSITGAPSESDIGSVSPINLSVSDGTLTSSIDFDVTVTKPIFFLEFEISTLDEFRDLDLEINSCFMTSNDLDCAIDDQIVTINDNGVFKIPLGIKGGSNFEVSVDRDAGRQDCELSLEEGAIAFNDRVIGLECKSDDSAPLFSLDKMHKIRLTMDGAEWLRFVLDTERADYRNGTASGPASLWTNWSHSEIYRQVDFEYLDENNNVIESLEKVGFKMRGNTSRQWPEVDDEDTGLSKPKRFSFGLKFDEKFDEDEGVYSCIDGNGDPASVVEYPCLNRVGMNHPEVADNDGREFMGVEKVFFRYNRDDPTYQRELLAHDVLNRIGVPASRVAHANVILEITGTGNLFGQPLPQTYNMGVFQMVEQIDKPFLKRFFGKNGFLFKSGVFATLAGSKEADINCVPYDTSDQFFNTDFCNIGVEKSDPDSREEWLGTDNYLDPAFVNSNINNDGGEESQFRPYRPIYDLKTKKKSITEGRQLLQDFITFLQSNPSELALAERFDINGFIKAQAAEIVMGAVDHYVRVGNNYYLYLNPTTGLWTYFVNDFDFVFRDSHSLGSSELDENFGGFRDIMETYAFPSPNKIDWAGRASLLGINPILWTIVFSEPENKNKLFLEIKSILELELNWDAVEQKLVTRNALVRSAILATDAGSPGGANDAGSPSGCGQVYNPGAIDAPEGTDLCDAKDVSIKEFIETRSATLYQELQENGYQ
ncbi:MAG: hypothetical protein HOM60_04760 [Porticoccaceae bacterium]|nr:hypothetical protein [Porticoccaceae bacterium]